MKIYYIDIEEFKKQKTRELLEQYNDIHLQNQKRFFEYTIGRYLVKNVAKSIYNLDDTEIILDKNSKPVFKGKELYFNISHSKNIVIACFDSFPCGIDVEFIRNRDLLRLEKYFKREFKDLEDFYKFWTFKEANYKLGCDSKYQYFSKFIDEYYLAITSLGQINCKIEKFEI